MGKRGYLATLAAVTVVALAIPASAAALTYCVNRAGPACQQSYNENQLQDALNDADLQSGAERILIGAGLYDDGPYSADSNNQVEIVGAGPAATTLRKGFGNDQTVLTLDQAASSVEDVGIELTSGNNVTGLAIRNAATRIRVTEGVTVTGTRTGVSFGAAGALVDSSVSLDVNAGTTAVNGVLFGSTAELTLQNNDLQAANGVVYQTPLHTERNRITARTAGIGGIGPLEIDAAAIRMVGAGGPNPTAVSVGSSQFALTPLSGQLVAQHLTAFGSGAGFGVVIGAGCYQPGGPGGNSQGLPASGEVRDTIVDGFASDFRVAGRPCFDPVLATDIPSPANLDVDYSLFDPASVTQNQPASFAAGPNNLSGDPLLVDPSAGNLRPRQGSPVIDAGQPTPAAGNERDVAGNPRVQDGDGNGSAIRDMGAYEHTFDPGGPDPDPGPGPGPPGPGGDITRKLTLGYKANKDTFKGKLVSNEAACRAGKVKVFEKAKGKDPKAGSDKTNAAGKWAFEEKGAEGKFYAAVPQKSVPAGTCPAARSKAKKVG